MHDQHTCIKFNVMEVKNDIKLKAENAVSLWKLMLQRQKNM